MIRKSVLRREALAGLMLCAGHAAAIGVGPVAEPEKMDDELVRLIELEALSGPVITSHALPMPANRARLSRVTVRDGELRSTGEVWGLDVIDGNRDTKLSLRTGGQGGLDLSFIGAPRWLSRLRIDSDAALVDVEYMDVNGKWRPFGSGAGGGVIEGDLVRARALRVTPVVGARGKERVDIREVDAWFEQTDTDDGATSGLASAMVPEYFYEWCETYASSPLSVCSEECEGLGDELSGWSVKGFGNGSAWEEDFKRSASGGTENSYVDANDLSYFAGHGSSSWDSFWGRNSRNLLFSRTDRDDSASVPGDSYDSWGDLDMEWMFFAACQVMRDDPYWAASMDGIHMILGWETNMRDVTMGIDFGKRAIGTSIFDPPRRVLDSWFWAAEKNHGSGYKAFVVGENSAMGNDYLWGEGFVNPDPVDDSTYTWWSYNTGSAGVLAPAGHRDGLEKMDDLDPDEPVVRFEGKGERAVPVVIPERLLNRLRGGAAPMKVYDLNPPQVNEQTVAGLADQLCQTLGLFCNADIGPDKNQTEFSAMDGPWELRVNVANAGFELVHTGVYGAPVDKPRNLPDPGQSAELVQQVLGQSGLLPQDAVLTGVDTWSQAIAEDGKEGPPTELLPAVQMVKFVRNMDGFPVCGPAGELVAHVGEQGLAQVQQNVRMSPRAIGEVEPTDLGQILEDLAQNPQAVAIDGITLVPDQIKVLDARLCYFISQVDLGPGESRAFVRPAYTLDCLVTERNADGEPGESSPLEINAWADTTLPVVQIEGDTGGCAEYGQTLCFQALVQGGTPPYTYSWSDPVSGEVGTGDKVCFDLEPVSDPADDGGDQTVLAPGEKETGESWRAIEITVTDDLGTTATSTVNIQICQPSCPADVNGDGVADNGDIGAFIILFLANDPAADFNNDGIIDNGDIGAFVPLFLAG
ncbi:MAG: DUF6345 domain-containing protein, partial [Phycisphaerales bacterium JB040]